MSTPEERYEELVARRDHILSTTTPEERSAGIDTLLGELNSFGETHFPNGTEDRGLGIINDNFDSEFSDDELRQLFVSLAVRPASLFTNDNAKRRPLLQKLWEKLQADTQRSILLNPGLIRRLAEIKFPYKQDANRLFKNSGAN